MGNSCTVTNTPDKMNNKKPPIINCHVHTFTGDHVPPYLAKSILVCPFYFLLNFQWVFAICRWYFNKKDKANYGGIANAKRKKRYFRQMYIQRHKLLFYLINTVGWYLTFQAVDILLHRTGVASACPGWIKKVHHFLVQYHILWDVNALWTQVAIVLIVMLFFRSGRNLVFFVAKNTIGLLKKLPGKETKALLARYMTIGRYTFHRSQGRTLDQLQRQYPEGSGFVILPMDMTYMKAGKLKQSYYDQMQTLVKLKEKEENIYPFVFVDPRRIAADENFFKYTIVDGEVILEKGCIIQQYIEQHKFSGFKIYPALGYFPFDPLLLPLWKYAAKHNIPILTHCVRGPMYYRGKKSAAWDEHPIFKQASAKSGVYDALLLSEKKNDAFSANFTHPMNFLCLLKKKWLAEVVDQACKADGPTHHRLKEIFELTYVNEEVDGEIKLVPKVGVGLDDLKICLGHYGGNDEWERYLESDRYYHNNELSQRPNWGIEFLFKKNSIEPAPGKAEQLWKSGDWYSIISSMMLQHPHVYADISYILHSESQILPLLKQTLQNPGLQNKVLYGTDFFVVRNHKSDKHMLSDMMGGLSEKDFDQVARINPRKFLNLPDWPN